MITRRTEEKEDTFQPLPLKPWLLLFIFTRKFLLLTDRGYSACQSLQFIRGLQGFTEILPSTVFVRGNRWPNYQEVVTRYPLCGSSELLYSVGCIQGQSTLSFGLIVPDNRYVMHYLIHCLIIITRWWRIKLSERSPVVDVSVKCLLKRGKVSQ